MTGIWADKGAIYDQIKLHAIVDGNEAVANLTLTQARALVTLLQVEIASCESQLKVRAPNMVKANTKPPVSDEATVAEMSVKIANEVFDAEDGNPLHKIILVTGAMCAKAAWRAAEKHHGVGELKLNGGVK